MIVVQVAAAAVYDDIGVGKDIIGGYIGKKYGEISSLARIG